MNLLKIALLQIAPGSHLADTQNRGIEACRHAKELGADIALFPEMFSNGYRITGRPVHEWQAEAITKDSDFVCAFQKLANQLNMAIALTILEKYPGAPRNTMVLFDRFGQEKLTYAKVHTCDFEIEHYLTAGDTFSVAELDTACGLLKVGAMICYDREFPESARILMLQGAELILVPNACPMEINRLSQLRARAFENMLAIATCNYPDTVPDCNGRSSVFDGVAYIPKETDSRDTCILQAPEKEGIYLAELDLNRLREYRQIEIWGNCYRHPQKYRQIIEEEIKPPFIRKNHR